MLAASNPKLLSEELEIESKKVRSMYEVGQSIDWISPRLSVPEITTSKFEEQSVVDDPGMLVIPIKT